MMQRGHHASLPTRTCIAEHWHGRCARDSIISQLPGARVLLVESTLLLYGGARAVRPRALPRWTQTGAGAL